MQERNGNGLSMRVHVLPHLRRGGWVYDSRRRRSCHDCESRNAIEKMPAESAPAIIGVSLTDQSSAAMPAQARQEGTQTAECSDPLRSFAGSIRKWTGR